MMNSLDILICMLGNYSGTVDGFSLAILCLFMLREFFRVGKEIKIKPNSAKLVQNVKSEHFGQYK